MSYSFASIRYIPDTLERCIASALLNDALQYDARRANDAQLCAWVNHPDFYAVDDTLQAMVIDEVNKRIAFKFNVLCEIV